MFALITGTFRDAKIVGAGHVLGAWPARHSRCVEFKTFDEMAVPHKTHASGTRLYIDERLSSLYTTRRLARLVV